MNPLRLLIVDDEPLARLRLRGLVSALGAAGEPRCEVVAEAATASQAAAWLREHACDVVLLDVQMPGVDGLQFADALAQRPAGVPGVPPPLVIFVTAHAAHALRAFELQALDYLTKPVRRERLQAALARAAQRLLERAAAQARPPAGAPAAAEADDFITLTDRGRVLRVPLAEVLYFKAELKYLTLRTAGETLVMDGALSELEQRYGERFLRVHRNALVARWAVRELQRRAAATNFGELDGGEPGEAADSWAVRIVHVDEWISVSRRQVAAVRDALARQGR